VAGAPAETGIEITPEMIRAGYRALMLGWGGDEELAVEFIFQEMWATRYDSARRIMSGSAEYLKRDVSV
jgi:hypothetical protein